MLESSPPVRGERKRLLWGVRAEERREERDLGSRELGTFRKKGRGEEREGEAEGERDGEVVEDV